MNQNYPPSENEPALAQGYWVRLTGQMDRLQATVEELLAATETTNSQTAALLRHLTDPERGQAIAERLAELSASQESAQAQWLAVADRLSAGLNEVTQALARLNRTQFRANTLAEMKDQQVTSALETLREVAARREQLQEARAQQEQARATALRSEGRSEFAADLLPVLDGLELALESGRSLLERQRSRQAEATQVTPPTPPTFWQRLAWALWGRGLPPGTMAPAPPATDLIAGVEAWLQGLEMVRTRCLALLATADIEPIQADGQPFDPRWHLAMATAARSDVADGVVVSVLRRGYRQRDRVVRYAEVVVNRAPQPAAPTDDSANSARTKPTGGYLGQAVLSESEGQ